MPLRPIVAATDGSEDSLRTVEWAAREAVLHHAELRIVSAPAPPVAAGTVTTALDPFEVPTETADRLDSGAAPRTWASRGSPRYLSRKGTRP